MNNLYTHFDNLLSREKAEALLAPHRNTIRSSCFAGHGHWLEFCEKMPHLRFPLTQRTGSGFINDWIVQEARIGFASAPGVQMLDDLGFFYLAFDKRLLLRFKKADDDGRTSNVKTQQQQEIAAQMLVFPGWEDVTWVSAGYHLTKTAEAIDRVSVTCWYADRSLWAIPIYDKTSSESVLPFDVEATPQQTLPKPTVRPKGLKKPVGNE